VLLNYHVGRFVLGSLCVGDLVRMGLSGVRVAGFMQAKAQLQHRYHSNPTTSNLQHKSNQEQYYQCGNSRIVTSS